MHRLLARVCGDALISIVVIYKKAHGFPRALNF